MAVARNTPKASQLNKKIGKIQSAGCRLRRIPREARGESTVGLAVETYGHMSSAGCEGMVMIVWLPATPFEGTCMTACMLHKSQKASSSLSLLTKKIT